MYVKMFGFVLAGGVIATSVAMMILGGRWQRIEAAAYAGKHRPLWFWIASVVLIAVYGAILFSFIRGEKNWAGWVLAVVIPAGWAVKGALVTFNPKGRKTVSSVSGDAGWTKVALARLPVAVILAVLAWFA